MEIADVLKLVRMPWAERRKHVRLYPSTAAMPEVERSVAEVAADVAEHDAFTRLLAAAGLTLDDLALPTRHADTYRATCDGCGKETSLDLLDAKPGPDTVEDYETFLCAACYGPGWDVPSWRCVQRGRQIARLRHRAAWMAFPARGKRRYRRPVWRRRTEAPRSFTTEDA